MVKKVEVQTTNMIKLFNRLGIYNDKQMHFIVGFIICAVVSVYNACYGLTLCVLAGIGKEVYDFYDYHKFDYKDMLATWLGGILAFVLFCYVL